MTFWDFYERHPVIGFLWLLSAYILVHGLVGDVIKGFGKKP